MNGYTFNRSEFGSWKISVADPHQPGRRMDLDGWIANSNDVGRKLGDPLRYYINLRGAMTDKVAVLSEFIAWMRQTQLDQVTEWERKNPGQQFPCDLTVFEVDPAYL